MNAISKKLREYFDPTKNAVRNPTGAELLMREAAQEIDSIELQLLVTRAGTRNDPAFPALVEKMVKSGATMEQLQGQLRKLDLIRQEASARARDRQELDRSRQEAARAKTS